MATDKTSRYPKDEPSGETGFNALEFGLDRRPKAATRKLIDALIAPVDALQGESLFGYHKRRASEDYSSSNIVKDKASEAGTFRLGTYISYALPALSDAAETLSSLAADQRAWLDRSEARLERLARDSAANEKTMQSIRERFGV